MMWPFRKIKNLEAQIEWLSTELEKEQRARLRREKVGIKYIMEQNYRFPAVKDDKTGLSVNMV